MCCEAPLRLCVYDVMFFKKVFTEGSSLQFFDDLRRIGYWKIPKSPLFFLRCEIFNFFHRRVLPSICLMICDRMDEKSQSVASGVPIRFNFWVFRVLWKRILSHFEVLLLFLVGAFSFKEKSPTITVASFFFFFFRQTTELIAYVPLFTETDKFTQAKFDQCKLTAKGPPFRFLPFLRNLQNRKTPKGPFQFFSALCEFFFENF